MNATDLKEAIKTSGKLKRALRIIGAHGIGKSQIVYQTAAEMGYTVVEKRLGLIADPGDLTGLPDHDRDTTGRAFATRFVQPDWFPTKGKVILFLDELGRAHKDILQAVFELVYDHRLNGVALPEDVVIVCADNPPGGEYQTLDFTDPAFQDRFIHVWFTPTNEEFLNYGRTKNWNRDVISFLAENQSAIRGKAVTPAIDLDFVQPSQRSWEAAAKLMDMEGVSQSVRNELLIGLVGQEAFARFRQYLETQTKMPTAEEILGGYDAKCQKIIRDSVKAGREDLVGVVLEEMIALYRNKREVKPAEMKALLKFSKDIPDEMFFGLFHTLVHIQSFTIQKVSEKEIDYNKIFDDKDFAARIEGMVDKISVYREMADKRAKEQQEKAANGNSNNGNASDAAADQQSASV